MPAYDPAFTAASCFILRPGASGRLLWVFTLFLWLIILYSHLGAKSTFRAPNRGKKFT